MFRIKKVKGFRFLGHGVGAVLCDGFGKLMVGGFGKLIGSSGSGAE